VSCRYAREAGNDRNDDEKQNQPEEQEYRVRQLIATTFNPAKNSRDLFIVGRRLRRFLAQKSLLPSAIGMTQTLALRFTTVCALVLLVARIVGADLMH